MDNVWQAGVEDRGGQADKQLHLSDPTIPLVKYTSSSWLLAYKQTQTDKKTNIQTDTNR